MLGKFKGQMPIRPAALTLAASIVGLDQITKVWIRVTLPVWHIEPVVPGVMNLVHVHNRGAAFGFLNSQHGVWQPIFFILVSVLAVAVILSLLWTSSRQDRLFQFSLSAILGGALGNLVDRIRFGMVTDFVDVYFGPYHWPAFNVADMAISVGAFLLLIAVYRQGRHASNSD